MSKKSKTRSKPTIKELRSIPLTYLDLSAESTKGGDISINYLNIRAEDTKGGPELRKIDLRLESDERGEIKLKYLRIKAENTKDIDPAKL